MSSGTIKPCPTGRVAAAIEKARTADPAKVDNAGAFAFLMLTAARGGDPRRAQRPFPASFEEFRVIPVGWPRIDDRRSPRGTG